MIMFYIGDDSNMIGLQLGHHNILSSKGNIKIAKYGCNYNPNMGYGYNIESHLKIAIKYLKKKIRLKKIIYRKFFTENLCKDLLQEIEKYL